VLEAVLPPWRLFACSFFFAERSLMKRNAKVIKPDVCDEASCIYPALQKHY